MLIIGTHMSIAGGLAKTAENVVEMEANTMQIFSRNPRGSNFRVPEHQEREAFRPFAGACPLYDEPGQRAGEGI